MITKIAIGTTVVFIAMAGAVRAQNMNMDCTKENMATMQSQIDAMTKDAQKAQKKMAMADMEKAKQAMQANQMEECKAHMSKIMKDMMKG